MKIAITGTIAAGKTTVAILFKRRGFPVFNADQYAKRALYQGSKCYDQIIETFGKDVIADSGDIDAKKLAHIVFEDNEKRLLLNQIVHPFVLEGMQKFFFSQKDSPILFAEIPLLYETGWDTYFDQTIVVTCSQQVAIQRMMEDRGYTKQEAISRLDMQIPASIQVDKADIVIYNDTDLQELNHKVNQVLAKIRKDQRHG
ncbi:MAG: dephospho-CoA kinase [Erysipelotrichaceae bacterium]|nr:dephospho-CoA kinase [Erysipelotrichaceae bacterium]MDY6034635.1 dephospho-CoA kinase [Bulleidia sp.]